MISVNCQDLASVSGEFYEHEQDNTNRFAVSRNLKKAWSRLSISYKGNEIGHEIYKSGLSLEEMNITNLKCEDKAKKLNKQIKSAIVQNKNIKIATSGVINTWYWFNLGSARSKKDSLINVGEENIGNATEAGH